MFVGQQAQDAGALDPARLGPIGPRARSASPANGQDRLIVRRPRTVSRSRAPTVGWVGARDQARLFELLRLAGHGRGLDLQLLGEIGDPKACASV